MKEDQKTHYYTLCELLLSMKNSPVNSKYHCTALQGDQLNLLQVRIKPPYIPSYGNTVCKPLTSKQRLLHALQVYVVGN
jgi:hypothetical protein